MKKFKLYWDKDKEQQWINEMAQEGWALTKYFLGVYTFEKCEPGEYIYQIDLMGSTSKEQNEFKSFLEDIGVEIVAEWYRWIFLRKRAEDGEFEMYTDDESKIQQYKKIHNFFKAFFVAELVCFLMEINASVQTESVVFSVATFLIGFFAIVIGIAMWKTGQKIKSLEESK